MGEILRTAEVVARKDYPCCRCGGIVRKGERCEAIVKKFKLQLRTDHAHYLCRGLFEGDLELLRGHIFNHTLQVIDDVARAWQHDDDSLPAWLEPYRGTEGYEPYDIPWFERWDFKLDEYEREFERHDFVHVYGHEEPGD